MSPKTDGVPAKDARGTCLDQTRLVVVAMVHTVRLINQTLKQQ